MNQPHDLHHSIDTFKTALNEMKKCSTVLHVSIPKINFIEAILSCKTQISSSTPVRDCGSDSLVMQTLNKMIIYHLQAVLLPICIESMYVQ